MALTAIIWDLTTQALCLNVTAPAQEVTDQICGRSLARAVLSSQPPPPPWVKICSPAEALDTSPTVGTNLTDQGTKETARSCNTFFCYRDCPIHSSQGCGRSALPSYLQRWFIMIGPWLDFPVPLWEVRASVHEGSEQMQLMFCS